MWFPYESFTVQTGESPEALARRLRPQVACPRSWVYWLFYDTDGFFQGRVHERGFTLLNIPRSILFLQYRLAAYGRFRPLAGGTEIRVKISLPWWSWVSLALLWYPVGIFCIVLVLLNPGSPGSEAWSLAFMGFFLSVPWLIYGVVFWVLEPRYREEIERLLYGE